MIEPFAHPFPDGWIEPDVGNNAVGGPFHNAGWNIVGSVDNDKGKYKYYTGVHHW